MHLSFRSRACPSSAIARLAGALIAAAGIAAPVGAQPLSLEEAMRLAEGYQPLAESRLAVQRAADEAAVAAGQLPDPQLKLGLINVPATGPDAFSLTSDFMTMRTIGVEQMVTRQAKRDVRSQLMRIQGEQKTLEIDGQRLVIRRDAALAWLDAYYAERASALTRSLKSEAHLQADALLAAARAGRASQADALGAKLELTLLDDREAELANRVAMAQAELSRWIGNAAQRPLGDPSADATAAPTLEQVLADIPEHPRLHAADEGVTLAAREAELARLSTRPDWKVELSYGIRGSAFSDMVTLQFGIDLPVFQKNRQLRDVAAKLALTDRARAERDDSLRAMQAEARRVYAQWTSVRERAQRYRTLLLPQSKARIDAALASYRAGRGELTAVLAARRADLELQLQLLALEAEAARATIQLSYFSA